MSLREGEPALPTSHYFLSVSRGDAIRTFMVRPAALWAIAALALVSLAWAAAATAYVAFHDDLMGAIVARQAQMETAYEDRLAEARARLDEVASRQLLDQNSFEGKVHELLSRQARLEQRGAIVAALAAETRQLFAACAAESGGVQARSRRARRDPGSQPTTAGRRNGRRGARLCALFQRLSVEPRAAKPHPVDDTPETLSALTGGAPPPRASLAAAADNLDASARLGSVDRSLDRMESGQIDRSCGHRPHGDRHLGSRRRDRRRSRPRSGEARLGPMTRAASAVPISRPKSIRRRPRSTRRSRASRAMWRRPTA